MHRTLVLLGIVLACWALPACRSKPGLAVGWSATDALTGPRLEAGEYELENPLAPFGDPDGDAAPPAPTPPDPALVASLKSLEEKQAAAEARDKELDAKVAAGQVTPEKAAEFRKGLATAEELTAAAREADKKYADLLAKLNEAEKNAPQMPPWLPKDFTIPGLIAFAGMWGAYLLRKKGLNGLRALVEQAKADAMAHTKRAIEAFDNLPETATSAEVREAIAPPTTAPAA